jgi:biotin carboxyl carrier protein
MSADHDDPQRPSHRHPGCSVTAADRGADRLVVAEVIAEDIDVPERLVIAPVAGMFFPAFTEVSAEHPGMVAVGDEIGVVVQTGEKHPVTSSFTGRVMGMLAMPGERVRTHQPVAWLSILDD